MDTERILGRLEEHSEHTSKRLDRIEHKIDLLQAFKWKVLGASSAISMAVTFLLEKLLNR
jgi:hypothetical protein